MGRRQRAREPRGELESGEGDRSSDDPDTLPAMSRRFAATAVIVLGSLGCGAVAPPASQLPTAEAALDRRRETGRCATAIQASAKIDHFGKSGRVRGDLL